MAEIIGDATQYRISLVSYYMALNVLELADTISQGEEDLIRQREKHLSLDIPLCFVSEGPEINDRALSLLTRPTAALETLWSRCKVPRDRMEALWPDWLRHCAQWVSKVYRFAPRQRLPHADLFEMLP